jgi:hypothetical protein
MRVCIETQDNPAPALPVRARNIYAVPFRQPFIDRVLSRAGPQQPAADQPILATYILVLVGQRLSGPITRVLIAGTELAPAADQVADDMISVALPASLHAGVHAVQAIQLQPMGTPPTPHRGVESNVAAFVLHPTVTASATHISSRNVGGVNVSTSDISCTFIPPVGKLQRVGLLLSELNAPADRAPRSYSFTAPARDRPADPAESASIVFRATDVVPGAYLLRVQVDGAESPLAVDAQGLYSGPKVTIT